MSFLKKGCGNLDLKAEDAREMAITPCGIQKVKQLERGTSKEALKMAKRSAANNKGVEYDALSKYIWSGERVKTQDEINYEKLKKGGVKCISIIRIF